MTPEFHRGEGFSRLFLDSPWPSGRLLTLPATIPAIPQVLHLPISLGIHLRVAVMQVGGYRPQFRPHPAAHSVNAQEDGSTNNYGIGQCVIQRLVVGVVAVEEAIKYGITVSTLPSGNSTIATV